MKTFRDWYELLRQSEPGRHQDLVQTLDHGAGDAWCFLLEAPGKVSKKPLGGVCIIRLPGLAKCMARAGMQMPGQAIDDVPALVDAAAPDLSTGHC